MEVVGIAYVGWESTNHRSMLEYGPEVFGFGLNESVNDDSVYLRMDDHAWRIAVHPGPRDRLAYVGWEMKDSYAWEQGVEELRSAGVEVTIGHEDLEEQRACYGVAQFVDPDGWPHELVFGHRYDTNSFRPGRAHRGFNTNHGLGHIASVPVSNLDEVNRFCRDVMQHRWYMHGPRKGRTAFWRAKRCELSHNIVYRSDPTHEYGDTTQAPHMGLYNRSLDDVGIALDRVLDNYPEGLHRTLGRHTQDPVVSFYSRTPAGFDIEFIWSENVEVPDETYVEGSAARISVWGHRSPTGEPIQA